MKKLLTLLALLIGAGANAQTLGDVLTWKKGPGLGDAKLYTTPVNSSTNTVATVGPIMGSTMDTYTRHAGMPSSRAAFQISSSMPRRPASISAITRPEACQTVAMTMV